MTELDALVAAAAWGLPTSARTVTARDADRDLLLHAVERDRLGGLMAAAMDDGTVRASPELATAVTASWHDQLVAAVAVECLVVEVADVLGDASVQWRLTKGPALAHLDYPDPSLRPFGDIDVLIHPGHWSRAMVALAAAGWARDAAELGPEFDERFGKGATLTNEVGLELDAHRRLAVGRFGLRLDTTSFFDDADWLELGGRAIPCLTSPHRLMHACFHASLGGFRRLRAFRDVAQLLLVADTDWRQTTDLAERLGVEAVVASAVLDTWQRLALTDGHPALAWAHRQRIGALDRQVLRIFREERSYAREALTGVPDLVGRGATRYLWNLAVKPGRRRSATG